MMVLTVKPGKLSTKTLDAFDVYIRNTEMEMEQSLSQNGCFLWSQQVPERTQAVVQGQVVAQRWSGKGPANVPDGLIHDWIAALFISDVNIQQLFAVMQDYDNHKITYTPEVVDSKLISRDGDEFCVYLRLLKKKIITVVLDTDHEVHYRRVDRTGWECRSHTTRIAEVEDAGSQKERVLDADTGYGFLWRLNSYWRFEERNAGIFVECRAISLTRDVPFGLGWAIEPIIEKLPKESLVHTLEATRQAVLVKARHKPDAPTQSVPFSTNTRRRC